MATICALALPAASFAAPGPPPTLNKQQLERKTCGRGTLVINAVQKVLNDVDSGVKGNIWAFDDYTRTLKVWRVGQSNYCSIVGYEGTFRTIAGPSPGGGRTLTSGIKGHVQGGYRMDFSGKLLARPAVKTHGSIGTVNYRCDANGNCPGSVYWVTQFFSNVTGDDFDWWGWLYKAGRNGTWLNSIDGAKGDIVALPNKGKKK